MPAQAWAAAGACCLLLLLGTSGFTRKPRQAWPRMRHMLQLCRPRPDSLPTARHPRMAARPPSVIVRGEREVRRRLHRGRGPGQGAGTAGSRPGHGSQAFSLLVVSPEHSDTSQGGSWPLPSHLTPAPEVVGSQRGANSALENPRAHKPLAL